LIDKQSWLRNDEESLSGSGKERNTSWNGKKRSVEYGTRFSA
jgi:hypothetical protein